MSVAAAVRHRRVPIAVSAILLAVYGLTLARDVTFWDAGEFIAAAASFGIPHPPGTPLFVMLLRAAVLTLGALGVPVAVATSLVSAVCTAAACGLGAAMLARGTGDRLGAIAGGVAAGTMASVWLNATETEVYAASLALSLAILWAAERAGRLSSMRWTMLAGYLLVLAVPLHLSALLVAPAALYLVRGAVGDTAGAAAGRLRVLLLLLAGAAAFALGTMRPIAGGVAGLGLVAAGVGAARRPDRLMRPSVRVVAGAVLLALVASSALLVLVLRARHDPPINQGNPGTWAALADVVARRQYAVAAPWPRQAPLWLQLANVVHYADWQVALSLGPTIFPTPLRTSATLVFTALAVFGARAHRRRDPRGWTAFALLLGAGTLGVALYLNLRAGPSFGYGVLPEGTLREARERDYFFVLGWWAWGAWGGYGAVAAARRLRAPAWAGGLGAAMPLLLNWHAVDRTRLPEAALPRAVAEGLLAALPERAVLFVAGDNDTYPLWYAQQVLRMRDDVTIITTPLLPADWYRLELARRHALFAPFAFPYWEGEDAAVREIAQRAGAQGRPVAFSIAMRADERALVGDTWVMRGPVYLRATDEGRSRQPLVVDTAYARQWTARLDSLTAGRNVSPSTDGTAGYMLTLLACPGTVLAHQRAGAALAAIDSLAPRCNLR